MSVAPDASSPRASRPPVALLEAERRERAFTRRAGWGLWALATLLVAAIAHIGSILVMPSVAPDDAFARLSRLAPPGVATTLGFPTANQQITPFADPAVALAVCRFDLRQGPLRVRAPVADDGFLSLSVRARDNASVYALTDRAAVRGRLDLLVVTARQLEALEESDGEDGPTETRVTSPTLEGYVLLRALAPSQALREETLARLRLVSCEVEPM